MTAGSRGAADRAQRPFACSAHARIARSVTESCGTCAEHGMCQLHVSAVDGFAAVLTSREHRHSGTARRVAKRAYSSSVYTGRPLRALQDESSANEKSRVRAPKSATVARLIVASPKTRDSPKCETPTTNAERARRIATTCHTPPRRWTEAAFERLPPRYVIGGLVNLTLFAPGSREALVNRWLYHLW